MDQRFDRVFRDLYDRFSSTSELRQPSWFFERQLLYSRYGLPDQNVVLLVRDALERAIGRLEVQDRLRSDARYFLLINFSQMIAEPLSLDQERQAELNALAADIQSDAETVLRSADRQNVSERLPREQISGGDVLQAVADNYKDLKVNRYRVWN